MTHKTRCSLLFMAVVSALWLPLAPASDGAAVLTTETLQATAPASPSVLSPRGNPALASGGELRAAPPLVAAAPVDRAVIAAAQTVPPARRAWAFGDLLRTYGFVVLGFVSVSILLGVGLFYVLRLARQSHDSRTELIGQLGKWRKAEEALQESELRYRRLVQLSPDAVYVLCDRRMAFTNAAGFDFLGASSPEELLDKDFLGFVHPDDCDSFLQQIHQSAEEGRKVPLLEERFIRLDGQVLHVEVTAIPQTYRNRPAVQIVARDISERKRAELERNILAWLGLQLVAADTPRGIAFALKEATATLFHWDAFSFSRRIAGTDRFRRLIAFDTAEGEKVAAQTEEDGLSEFAGMEEYLEGKPFLLNRQHENDRPMTRFGNRNRASASLMFAPVTLPGEVFGVVTVQSYRKNRYSTKDLDLLKSMADLVAPTLRRTQAEEALRDSEERYRRLFNSAHDAVFVYWTDSEGAPGPFIEVNDPAFQKLGYTREELLALTIDDVQERDDPESWRDILHRLFRDKHVLHELVHVTKSKKRIPVEINAHLFEFKDRPAVLAIARDISERKHAENALRESEVKFRTVFEKAAIGIVRTDLQGRILETNPAFQQMLGYQPEELQGVTVAELTRSEDWEFEKSLSQGLEAGARDVYRTEKRYIRRTGETLWINLTISVVRSAEGEPECAIGMVEDISTRKQMEERLRFDALHDALTRLPNRSLFLDRLTHAIVRTRRNKTNRFAVLYMDVDDFKKVNDSLGHQTGDQLLLELAERIQNCLRPEDTVARMGGDEFALLLETVPDAASAAQVTQRLLESIGEPFVLLGREVHVSASIGLLHSQSGGRDAQEYLRDADTAMYHAKRGGKNRFAVFDPSMHDAVLHRLTLEEDLRRALRNREFVLHYQPIIDVDTNRVCGFEALARWIHPERGILAPDIFIQTAEDTGLIVLFGQWVMEEACRQTRIWQRTTGQPLSINVNLSPRQFVQADLPEKIAAILESTGLAPELLTLEVTENILLEHGPTTLSTLGRLKRLGVKLCIDDFGTGYSSLSYLNRFPIDALKIDRSFVMHMSEMEENLEIVRAVRALARSFGLDVVAEGVESGEQLDQLRLMGYQYVQGFYFYPALEVAAAADLLAEQYGSADIEAPEPV